MQASVVYMCLTKNMRVHKGKLMERLEKNKQILYYHETYMNKPLVDTSE